MSNNPHNHRPPERISIEIEEYKNLLRIGKMSYSNDDIDEIEKLEEKYQIRSDD